MSAWGSWDEMTQLMKYLQRRHAAIHSSTSTSMFTSHILTSHSTHQDSPFTFHMSPLPTPFGTCSPLLFRCQCLECRFALEGTNQRQQYPTAWGFLTETFTHIPVEWQLTGKRRKVPLAEMYCWACAARCRSCFSLAQSVSTDYYYCQWVV